jgi:hypothetical protein
MQGYLFINLLCMLLSFQVEHELKTMYVCLKDIGVCIEDGEVNS